MDRSHEATRSRCPPHGAGLQNTQLPVLYDHAILADDPRLLTIRAFMRAFYQNPVPQGPASEDLC